MPRHLDQQLKLRLLRAVDAIGAHGSILAASRALSVTQPALTRSLQETEALLGLQLFERSGRGVRATPAGEVVLQSARRLLGELRRLDEELDRLVGRMKATIMLGALPVAAAGVLPGLLGRLRSQHPELVVQLVQGKTEELLPKLEGGELDLVIGQLYPPDKPDGLMREALYEEPISVLARTDHPVFETPITAEALRRWELVLPTIGQRVGQEIDQLLATLGLAPTTSMRSTSYGFIREMLHSTDFISVMPNTMMAGDLLRGTIRAAPLPAVSRPRPAGFIRRADTPLSPAAEVLVDGLRRYVEEIAAQGRHPGQAGERAGAGAPYVGPA